MQLKLIVDYEGTAYRGWQVQPSGPTVQAVLERALATVLREPVRVRGAGRTDVGVHACGQVAAVRVTRVPDDLARVQRSINALTPEDVAVREIAVVDDHFDPRRHARSRVYEYRLLAGRAPSPFWRRYAWHVTRPLEVTVMREAAAILEGTHDFAAFCAADAAPMRSTVRRVLVSRLASEGALLVYRVEANAFLKHMVRTIVGTLVEVGWGNRPTTTMATLLAGRDRAAAGATAPPHGLTLVSVRY